MKAGDWTSASGFDRDLKMNGVDRWRAIYRVTHPQLAALRLLRRAETARAGKGIVSRLAYFLFRFAYARRSLALCIDIPLGVCAPGLSIAHVGSIVINGDARVGPDCRIHQGVTIGATRQGSPSIGTGVFIGPNAVILGRIQIGDNSVIGAGAIVTTDLPEGSRVLAVAPRLVAEGRAGWTSAGSGLGPDLALDGDG